MFLLRAVKRLFGHNWHDVANKMRYGAAGPVAFERIWIDPREVTVALPHPTELGLSPSHPDYETIAAAMARARGLVGKVVSEEVAEMRFFPLDAVIKVAACRRHWLEGLSWEAAGAIDNLLTKIETLGVPVSGCASRQDVLGRYAALDAIFREVRAAGTLESKLRRGKLFARERDGVQIHLGRDGRLILGATGSHRLAMTQVLGIERIPASLGFVHRSALPLLPALRRAPALARQAPERKPHHAQA
ncbi:hypothetical protein BH23PSE1_BH23PSE1_07130 [soil metagenome]